MKISAFPKCYLDEISLHRTMSVFDWIEQARELGAEGLEMYEGFFWSLDDAYIDSIGEAIDAAGFAMPMLCCSPDFTDPDPDNRKRAVEQEARMIGITRRLGGAGAVCRVLSGQRRPGVSLEQGLEWVTSCIQECIDIAREHDIVLGLENLTRTATGSTRNLPKELTSLYSCWIPFRSGDISVYSLIRPTRWWRGTIRWRCCAGSRIAL